MKNKTIKFNSVSLFAVPLVLLTNISPVFAASALQTSKNYDRQSNSNKVLVAGILDDLGDELGNAVGNEVKKTLGIESPAEKRRREYQEQQEQRQREIQARREREQEYFNSLSPEEQQAYLQKKREREAAQAEALMDFAGFMFGGSSGGSSSDVAPGCNGIDLDGTTESCNQQIRDSLHQP